jgi:hypothetical protein
MSDTKATYPRRGLLVSIYTCGPDTTGGGVTCLARAPRRMAILLGVPDGTFIEGDDPADMPVLEIVRRQLERGAAPYIHAEPVGETRVKMAGGNFVYSSDSRYHRAAGDYPISVHDRVEGT